MLQISRLLVNGRPRPLGLDTDRPTLGWSYSAGAQRSVKQSAYRILISLSKEALALGHGDLWDSGKQLSRRNVHINYDGATLSSRQRCYWKVQVWDQDERMYESAIDWWETGLRQAEDWSAQWISASGSASAAHPVMPLLRHDFAVTKPIASARIYVSGLGQYELRLNGAKVGDYVLDPGWTHYDKTCLYTAYDVTAMLHERNNTIGVMLGNGFYNVQGGRYTKLKNSFGKPKCLLQLEILHEDGSRAVIASQEGWLAADGPIHFSCIYGGEDCDARLEQPGWERAGFAPDERWSPAIAAKPPLGTLRYQNQPSLKIMQRFQPVDCKPLDDGSFVFDLGQNFSGWVEIAVRGEAGRTVKLIPAELLHEDGSPNQTWTGAPYELNYILNGRGTEVWSPRFTLSGFRYVQVVGAVPEELAAAAPSQQPVLMRIEGQMIYPELEASGSFECSEPQLNRIHEIINYAILSNMKSVFTDCPHREKLGWLEQVHLMGPAVMYNYPVETLLGKILDDIRDAQLPNGLIPTIAPEYIVFEPPWDMFRHSVSWSATYILVPWLMYERYGQTHALEQHYDGMKRYIDYVIRHSDNYIVQDGLGDWYDVGEQGPGFAQNTPVALPETAMLYHVVEVLQRISNVLKQETDAVYYAALSEKIKDAYNQAFFNPISQQYGSGSQASNAMSLSLGLVPKDEQAAVFGHLVQDIEAHGGHTTSGDVAHRFVLLALAQHGRSDLIHRMTMHTDYPSYGYQIVHGATSLTEAWDGPTVGKSQNHFMLGHIEEWFYSELAGLQFVFDAETEAYSFHIAPYLANGISYVRAHQELSAGIARCEWTLSETGKLQLLVEIPVNCSGTVHIPAQSYDQILESDRPLHTKADIQPLGLEQGIARLRIGSGTYRFTTQMHSVLTHD